MFPLDFLSKIPGVIGKAIQWAVAAIIITLTIWLMGKLGVPILPPPVINTTDNYIAVEASEPVFAAKPEAAGAGQRHRPLFMAFARAKAANEYRKKPEGSNLTHAEAVALTRVVSDDAIMTEIKKQGIDVPEAIFGGPLTNLLDWIKNNPEAFKKIVEIILMLIPLFADTGPHGMSMAIDLIDFLIRLMAIVDLTQ